MFPLVNGLDHTKELMQYDEITIQLQNLNIQQYEYIPKCNSIQSVVQEKTTHCHSMS